MKENTLKNFLGITGDVKEIALCECPVNSKEFNIEKQLIDRLFNIALEKRFVLYYDGRYVMEPYDGLEFKTEEEEFYYNNNNSYLVFQDITDVKVRFKIRYLSEYEYKRVYEVVKLAVDFTKKHPEVSDYKLY